MYLLHVNLFLLLIFDMDFVRRKFLLSKIRLKNDICEIIWIPVYRHGSMQQFDHFEVGLILWQIVRFPGRNAETLKRHRFFVDSENPKICLEVS